MSGQPEETLSPRDAALTVGVMDVLCDEFTGRLKAAREAAEPVFRAAGADGQTQQKVLLPDGTALGLISIKAGAQTLDGLSEDKLEAWVRDHNPDGMEDYLDPKALADAEVIEIIRALFPDLVRSRVRPATRKAMQAEMLKSGGWLVDADGEKHQLAAVKTGKPAGGFAYRPAVGAAELVAEAWRRGDLAHLPLGSLALPVTAAAPEGDGAS